MPNENVTLSTFGTGSQFVKSALMGLGATEQDPNGRFYLDGSMVHVDLSRVIAETIYIGDIFRDGQSVTGKFVTEIPDSGAVRVLLETPFDMTSRTLGYGGRAGTPGNAGTVNTNPDIVPTNDEIMIYLNQLNDQDIVFPDLQHTHLPLDIVAPKLASYAKSVGQDKSGFILAEILAYNIFRAMNSGNNILTPATANLSAASPADWRGDNSYGELVNELHSRLDNGDQVSGAFTYPTEGRTIIGRPRFVNAALNRKSGVILLGGDLAQEMLRAYRFDLSLAERNFVGNQYKGHAAGFGWQVAADYIWTLAERYLGLPAGTLDNVDAIAVSYHANAVAQGVDLNLKFIDSPKPRGTKAQPLNRWGAESYRMSQIIGQNTLSTTSLATAGFSANNRPYPIAPASNANLDVMKLPTFDQTGAVNGYTIVAGGFRPNGGNWNGVGEIITV